MPHYYCFATQYVVQYGRWSFYIYHCLQATVLSIFLIPFSNWCQCCETFVPIMWCAYYQVLLLVKGWMPEKLKCLHFYYTFANRLIHLLPCLEIQIMNLPLSSWGNIKWGWHQWSQSFMPPPTLFQERSHHKLLTHSRYEDVSDLQMGHW